MSIDLTGTTAQLVRRRIETRPRPLGLSQDVQAGISYFYFSGNISLMAADKQEEIELIHDCLPNWMQLSGEISKEEKSNRPSKSIFTHHSPRLFNERFPEFRVTEQSTQHLIRAKPYLDKGWWLENLDIIRLGETVKAHNFLPNHISHQRRSHNAPLRFWQADHRWKSRKLFLDRPVKPTCWWDTTDP